MIFKLQISLNDGGSQVLLYNQDRSITKQYEASDDIKFILRGRPKAYFEAKVDGDNIEILEEVPAQDW